MSIRKIGIIGAGIMGRGIALDFASNGFEISLHDINSKALESAKITIKDDLREILFFKQSLAITQFEALKISYHTDYQALADADFIIENIDECEKTKKMLLKNIQPFCNSNTIIAANTSCIPITELASHYQYPENIIGTHFMNPAPLQKLVEIIRGYFTSDSTLETAIELISSIGKSHVIVNDSPGFISNRLSHLLMNEAAFLVNENIANAKDIDKLFKEGYGHKMGPLETADLIGLDTVVKSLKVLFDQLQDPKFRCCPLLKKMVAAGKLGRKSGEGFYQYIYG